METITIAGQSFNVPVRYAAGHVLNEGEADALNQTFHENLRNNFAKKAKEGADEGLPLDVLQQQLDTYAEGYQFGARTGGGGSRDPVRSEAMEIARQMVRDGLRRAQKKLSDYTSAQISGAAEKLLAGDKGTPILEMARNRVAERQAAAGDDLDDIIGSIPAPTPANTQTASA